jgi:hypothetical protein
MTMRRLLRPTLILALIAMVAMSFGGHTVARAAAPDIAPSTASLVQIGDQFFGASLNDNDVVTGYFFGAPNDDGSVWSNGIFKSLTSPQGASNGGGYVTDTGDIYGTSEYSGGWQQRATKWTISGGIGLDMGADNAPDPSAYGPYNEFESSVDAVSPNGKDAGESTHCYGTDGNGTPDDCEGPYPAAGNPLKVIISLPGAAPDPSSSALDGEVTAINDSGEMVGEIDDHGQIFGGPALNFFPQAVAADGTVYGDGELREPDGTEIPLACGSDVYNVNDNGDILGGNGTNAVITHEGKCYQVSSLVPAADSGWTFPQDGGEVNNEGQILLQGYPPASTTLQTVLLTPHYPLSATISATETSKAGQYEFSTKIIDGTGQSTTTKWNFGDGETATSNDSDVVSHRYTRPGSYTVAGDVVDSSDELNTTETTTITVPAPRLSIFLSTPGHRADKLPPRTTVKLDVVVRALSDGVGRLSDLRFTGGDFTSSHKGVLTYSTSGTSPFSLDPGKARTFTTKVKTAGKGRTKLTSQVAGHDAINRAISDTARKTVTIERRKTHKR